LLDRIDQTIVAVSSAPGRGGIGIVRLTGPEAFRIGDRLARTSNGVPLRDVAGSTRTTGEVVIDDDVSFPADFYVFRGPHSYTRQDLVEIHTVGAPVIVEMVRGLCVARGALPAGPGEFTARAFVAGAMDLTTAEGVAAVIRARNDAQLRAARRLMDGSLVQRIRRTRDELAELLALVEADIDFAEEPIEFITPAQLRERLRTVAGDLTALASSAASIERLEELPRVLLLGRPNAGKSTLMNRLSGTQRSISADAAGTTRDVLSAEVRSAASAFLLLDAAGVDREAFDAIAVAGQTKALAEAQHADLICVVLDASKPNELDARELIGDLDENRVVVALNKCDLVTPSLRAPDNTPLPHQSGGQSEGGLPGALGESILDNVRRTWSGPVVPISAILGTGLDELVSFFAERLEGAIATATGEGAVLTERQRGAIREAVAAIRRADEVSRTARETIDCADVLAFELREALDALGAVTGEITTEDLLGQVFARFCIGK